MERANRASSDKHPRRPTRVSREALPVLDRGGARCPEFIRRSWIATSMRNFAAVAMGSHLVQPLNFKGTYFPRCGTWVNKFVTWFQQRFIKSCGNLKAASRDHRPRKVTAELDLRRIAFVLLPRAMDAISSRLV